MNSVIVAAPDAEPFTVAEAKAMAHTTISSVEHDALLTRLIATARKRVENDTGRILGAQQWRFMQPYWPKSRYLILPFCPLVSVTSVTYVTGAGVQTLAGASYVFQTRPDSYGQISLATGVNWPDAILLYPGLTVELTCGHSPVPDQLKEAIGALRLSTGMTTRRQPSPAPPTKQRWASCRCAIRNSLHRSDSGENDHAAHRRQNQHRDLSRNRSIGQRHRPGRHCQHGAQRHTAGPAPDR
ncbi:MAG: hypothetical protein V9G29_02890 [Burkholderiaceae bacterium]